MPSGTGTGASQVHADQEGIGAEQVLLFQMFRGQARQNQGTISRVFESIKKQGVPQRCPYPPRSGSGPVPERGKITPVDRLETHLKPLDPPDSHQAMRDNKPYTEWTLEELHKILFRSSDKETNRQILHKIVSEFPAAAELDRTRVENLITYLCEDPKAEDRHRTLGQISEQLVDEGLRAGVSQQALFEFIVKKAKEHHA